jgi:hypothetical protein
MDCCFRTLDNGDAGDVRSKIPGILGVGRRFGIKLRERVSSALYWVEGGEDESFGIRSLLTNHTQARG